MAPSENKAVINFRNYLRIKTVQPDPDYESAITFLKGLAAELQLPCQCVQIVPGRNMLLMTWEGTEPSLPSILLSSHMDVVPVFSDHWNTDPFGAEMNENGDIFARGAQDMKCVSIQYIEAIRRLKDAGHKLLRTIHLCFTTDEEIGSKEGMEMFVEMDEFKKLNIGFALDEGIANPSEEFRVFYAERSPWWVKVTCTGSPGHGSLFIKNTAGEKLRRVIDKFMDFRVSEEKRLESDPSLSLGDVVSTNFTMTEGGVQINVVPSHMSAYFDMRVPPTVDLVKFEETLTSWCEEAGEGITHSYLQKHTGQFVSSTDASDPWWKAFTSACNKLGLMMKTEIFPASADITHLRKHGIPALGFSPMNNTPILLHDHNEYLNEKVFLRGIDIYATIIPALADLPLI